MSTQNSRTLYTHQTTALKLIDHSLSTGHRRPVLQAPTGMGKSVVAAVLSRREFLNGGTVLFTCPSVSLITQTCQMFWSEGVKDIGVMQADHPMTNRNMPVQIATLQTLQRRQLPKASLVIIDECHVLFKKLLPAWFDDPAWRDVPIIGLSATPWTKGLGKLYDDYLVAATTAELIEAGFLSPFKVFAPAPEARPDLTRVKIVAGDYHEGQLSDVMSKANLVADVVATWKERAKGRPTLVFAVDRAHAQALQAQFVAAGIDTDYCDAFTHPNEREEIKRRMETGRTEVTVNIGTLTTGCDWPFVSCIVLARPTRSDMLFTQIVGRGLRKHPSKDFCLILDHSDTTRRLGFVTDIGRDFLDDGTPGTAAKKRDKNEPEPAECSKCFAILPPKTRTCPECGHTFQKPSEVTYTPGRLEEMTEGVKRERQPIKEKYTLEEKASWWRQLQGLAIEMKKPGLSWARAQYREKFKAWPARQGDYDWETPEEASPQVRSYVKSRIIAWAKRKERDGKVDYGRFY